MRPGLEEQREGFSVVPVHRLSQRVVELLGPHTFREGFLEDVRPVIDDGPGSAPTFDEKTALEDPCRGDRPDDAQTKETLHDRLHGSCPFDFPIIRRSGGRRELRKPLRPSSRLYEKYRHEAMAAFKLSVARSSPTRPPCMGR
jgi:hypothetical protein